jgi:hypothetical protein
MNIKKMATTIAFAALAMLVWTTFKVWFIHDPDHFTEMNARPYLIAWNIDNCAKFQCRNAPGDDWPVKGAFEADEGWIYVLNTQSGEIALLIPREDPSAKHLVTLEEAQDGDIRIVDNGPQPGEVSRGGGKTKGIPLYKQFKYMLGVLAIVIVAIFWIRRRASGDKRSLDTMLQEQAEPPPMDAAGIMAQAARKAPRSVAATPAPVLDANDPENVLPRAKAALASGNVEAAVAALRGFDKKYPGHVLIPDVYVFSAKLMAEKLGNSDMAKKLLQHVMDRYPGHYLAQEAKRTLHAMA